MTLQRDPDGRVIKYQQHDRPYIYRGFLGWVASSRRGDLLWIGITWAEAMRMLAEHPDA